MVVTTVGAPGIEWVGARDATQHPTVAGTAPQRVAQAWYQQCPGGDTLSKAFFRSFSPLLGT